MAAPVKAQAKRATARKAPARKLDKAVSNGNGHVEVVEQPFEPPTEIRPPEEFKALPVGVHPVYGAKLLYTYHPKDGSEPIMFPHISTCRPTALFFYENRNVDEMHQAFAWMDLCEIPTAIGRRLFLLPDEEQGALLREWFAGLQLTPPAGVSPPGES